MRDREEGGYDGQGEEAGIEDGGQQNSGESSTTGLEDGTEQGSYTPGSQAGIENDQNVDRNLRNQADDLQSRFLENNEEYGPNDVKVVQDGDQLTLKTTEEYRQEQRTQTARDLEQDVIENNDAIDDGGDIRVVQDGDGLRVETTEQFDREQRVDAAQQLEMQLIRENPNIDEASDVQITEGDDGSLQADITKSARRELREGDVRLLQERAEQQLEEEFESQVGRDVEAGEDFNTEVSRSEGAAPTGDEIERAQQAAQQGDLDRAADITSTETEVTLVTNLSDDFEQELQRRYAANQGAVSPTSTEIQQMDNQVDSQARRELRERTAEEVEATHPYLDRGDDYSVSTESEGGSITASVEFTDSGQREVQRRQDDIFSGVVAGTENALSRVAQISGSDDTRVEFRGEGSVVNVAATESQQATGEQFGDFNWTIPSYASDIGGKVSNGPVGGAALNVVEGQRVEDVWKTESQAFQQNIVQPVASAAGDAAASPGGRTATSRSLTRTGTLAAEAAYIATADGSTQQDRAQAAVDRGEARTEYERTIGSGSVEGLGYIADVPGLMATGKEGAELVTYGLSEAASGRGGQFAASAGGAAALMGAGATKYASENPGQFAGQLAGNVVGSVGAIGGAQRIAGARAGRAVSFAIQPGEELAISAARSGLVSSRTARMVPGVRSGHIGDVEAEASTGTSPSRFTGPIRSARERAPDVDVTVGQNAARGRTELNINADLQRRIVDAERAVARTPQRIRDGFDSAASGATDRLRSGAARVRQAPQATSDLATDIADYTRSVEFTSRSGLPSQQAVNDAAFRAGYRTQQNYNRLRGNIEGRVEGATDFDSPVPSQQDVNDAAFRAGYRAQQDYNRFRAGAQAGVRGVATRTRAGLQQNIDRLTTAASRPGDSLLDTDAGLPSQQAINDAAYRAGYRTQENYNRVRGNVEGRLDGATDVDSPLPSQQDVNDAAFRAGYRTQQSYNRFRSGFGVSTEGSRAEASNRGGSYTPMDLANPFLAAGERLGSAARSVRGASVRVDIGKPTARTAYASEMSVDDNVGAPYEFDGAEIDVNDAGEITTVRTDVEQDVGDGTVMREQQTFHTDARSVTRRESEQRTGTGTDAIRMEPNLYGQFSEPRAAGIENEQFRQTPAIGQEAAVTPEVGTETVPAERGVETPVEGRVETPFEGRIETPVEGRMEAPFEQRLEPVDYRSEVQPEGWAEIEYRTESLYEMERTRREVRLETEFGGQDPESSGFDGQRNANEFDFLNQVATPGQIL